MARAKLSKTLLDHAYYQRSDREFWDTALKGFGAKVNKNGTITFLVQ